VYHPYHSSFISEAALNFKSFVEEIEITKPTYKLISSIDQKILDSEFLVKEELVRNLYQPFAWMKTFQFMLNHQVELFIECGGGESLYKTGKFIEGDFKILNSKKIKKYLNA
jgi:malonyl CoA-acyl carrier protein transacylase